MEQETRLIVNYALHLLERNGPPDNVFIVDDGQMTLYLNRVRNYR